ncbi:MAG: hypothetical protein Q8K63_13195 [Acidimicrobiales bacterium]|nr:hypothetical protein [Acidimicrobiales bacterium]
MTDAALASYAATIAPEIDRVRMALVRGAGAALGEMIARFGITPDAAMVASMLRNLPPSRAVAAADVAELYVYQRDDYTDDALGVLRDVGLVEGDDVISLTPSGLNAITEVMDVLARVATSLWPAVPAELDAALAAGRRAAAQAAVTGGVTFGVVYPVHVPPGMTPLAEFLELLTPLRFHRFDAHVAAWRAAGHTAADLDRLTDAERAAVEADTNQRNAAAYAGLTADERRDLLAGLHALKTE